MYENILLEKQVDFETTKVMKALADNNRLRIINLLNEETLCVCELEKVMGLEQSNLSKHLNKLKEAQIILSDKTPPFIFHRINPLILKNYPFIGILIQQLRKDKAFAKDIKKLEIERKSGLRCERVI